MKYQKPLIIELSAQANGQAPQGCYNGTLPVTMQFCQVGGSPDNSSNMCNTGPQPGTSPDSDQCVSGSTPICGYCMVGTIGFNIVEDSCETGPAPA